MQSEMWLSRAMRAALGFRRNKTFMKMYCIYSLRSVIRCYEKMSVLLARLSRCSILTLSQSVTALCSAVSASIKFSVSSHNIEPYRSFANASARGLSLFVCIAASRHARPVAMS